MLESPPGDRAEHPQKLGAQHRSPRAGEETGLDEQRHDLRLGHGLAVETLDGKPLRLTETRRRANVLDQRSDRGAQPLLVRLAQRDERAAAALDVEGGLPTEEHDLRPRHAGGACPCSLRPRQRRAVRLRRIGCGEHERLGILVGAELTQTLDGAGKRELRAAEPFDEVATAAGADRLEILQLGVDGAVPARDPLAADAVARDDPLALEQQLGERAPVRRSGNSLSVGDQRPCVEVIDAPRVREKRRGLRSARAAS